MRLFRIEPVFVDVVPPYSDMEAGKLYISDKYHTAIHLCACGCGAQTVTPLNFIRDDLTRTKHGWDCTSIDQDTVTLTPSIGNFNFPCKSHYWIESNKVVWCK